MSIVFNIYLKTITDGPSGAKVPKAEIVLKYRK